MVRPMKKPEGKRRSPESRFYDTLKQNQVQLVLSRDGSVLTGKLLWVDKYSLGLRIEKEERLINKGSVEMISLLDTTGKQHEWRGDAS